MIFKTILAKNAPWYKPKVLSEKQKKTQEANKRWEQWAKQNNVNWKEILK